MESDTDNRQARLKERLSSIKQRIVNREVAIFTFFLILSFILWFLNALGKDMTGNIKFPAHYVNLSSERALVSDLPEQISLTVRGPGYSILKHKLSGNKLPLQIDLGKVNPRVTRDDQRYEFYILPFALREDFRRRLGKEFEIMTVSPDTISFVFDMISSRKVPVKPVVGVVPQKQYMVYGAITCEPDSVEVSGPASVIDTLSFVLTRPHNADQIKSSSTISLQLETLGNVVYSTKKINVFIPVEQFTEAVREVPVTVLNIPEDGIIRLFPEKVTVYCNVALRDYNGFMSAPLEAVSDMKGVDIRNSEKLKVTLRNIPLYVSSVRFAPMEVEYIFERN